MPGSKTRTDIYQEVTDQLITLMEQGVKPWTRPWQAGHGAGHVSKPLRSTGEAYQGINILMLWGEAMIRGFEAPIWITFKQALTLGGTVRKGAKSTKTVYAGRIERDTETDKGETVTEQIPFLKTYRVFNVEEVEGLPDHFYAPPQDYLPNPDNRDVRLDAFFTSLNADIRHGGSSAFYAPGPDHIQMPPYERFDSADDYYATLAHECAHWTGHTSRLDRRFEGKPGLGNSAYAREELVAELTAAFLCADFGIKLNDREDHAAYLSHWLKVLKDDKRAIFQAAAHAQRAADWMNAAVCDDRDPE